ncbi:MAG: type IA DNA topoisomerase [Eubacterium sp.]|nr:type IA DNA topoisomerase [Eubacterium sp.]
MAKSVYIAEKPSVAREFASALKLNTKSYDGYLESEDAVITWCVGHLVTMSYPEVYDEKYKKWRLDTLPFLPKDFKYEIIPSAKKQYETVARLLNREDVDRIYVCTDSGREGEYIYRLVDQMAKVTGKDKRRVWIDSQTEEEILRGIKEAKPLSEYDNLSESAYLRAKEDYLMGINFSRLLSLKYGNSVARFLGLKFASISVGRVMTCVLGMVVRREREIRAFVKTPFYRVLSDTDIFGTSVVGEWKVTEASKYYGIPELYKENGFKVKEKAEELIEYLSDEQPIKGVVSEISKKTEKKNPPLLFNLAELQNECSKRFKISPDETLSITQELYEKKLVTYPRTDARVLSTAIAKVITKNIQGLYNFDRVSPYAKWIMENGTYKGLEKTKYVNDKQITDHYAIIPTGAGFSALKTLNEKSFGVYELICRRFISIFFPAAEYKKISLVVNIKNESFTANFKVLAKEGYLKPSGEADRKKSDNDSEEEQTTDLEMLEKLSSLKKGTELEINKLSIKEGETSPPKRYNSGSIILAMENAGSFIEDESLREQIKGAGIGTSATRAEILKKLIEKKNIALNKKTQIITPTLMGEMIFDVVNSSIRSLLNPELTASWEKGLAMVASGEVTGEEYMTKLEDFIIRRTDGVMRLSNSRQLEALYSEAAKFYK